VAGTGLNLAGQRHMNPVGAAGHCDVPTSAPRVRGSAQVDP
jgi:hypothetical protein